MCCIFTCCGWMIDLVQRLWTFTMSCCISSAVCCVMLTSSMSGIALGYNYSLAEYIDLKETNVSVYIKRGVFDDEIADDMEWRRSGRAGGPIGREGSQAGMPADDESTTLRSGRRLDDSVFEADDAHRYEGSLMKLTARPPYEPTPPPQVTDDVEMGESVSKYQPGSIDQIKAIQSLVDSRRAMGTGGTTGSPLATYNINDRNLPYFPMYANPNSGESRRMMLPDRSQGLPAMNPARLAVPDKHLGSPSNWLLPKKPELAKKIDMPDYFVFSPTYPTPITLNKGLNLPISSEEIPDGAVVFVTRSIATTAERTKPAMVGKYDKETDTIHDKFLMDLDTQGKNEFKKIIKPGKSSEEEYEDEIKGLPVRKRRSIKVKVLADNTIKPTESNITKIHEQNYTNESTSRPVDSNSTKFNNIPSSIRETKATQSIDNEIPKIDAINFTNTKNQTIGIKGNNSQSDIQTVSVAPPTDQPTTLNENLKSESEHTVETTTLLNTQNRDNKHDNTLLGRIITALDAKKSSLMVQTTQKSNLVSTKKIKIRTRKKSFESRIVSSKYVPNTKPTRLFDTKQKTISNAEILNSIGVNLNEAGLLRNPASSTFVKLLQSTLT